MNIVQCRFCKERSLLTIRCNSEDGVGWVVCDGCGNMGTPDRFEGRAIRNWNKEQESETTEKKDKS
jgi:hypothetical protein